MADRKQYADLISTLQGLADYAHDDKTCALEAILVINEQAREAESLQSQLAAANERADGLQKIVDAARAQKPVAWRFAKSHGSVLSDGTAYQEHHYFEPDFWRLRLRAAILSTTDTEGRKDE